ncbi:MAG: uncharacterized protein JWN04_5963 [Myxococcaceae bacterium]|nr:uncharacterized protein [Myxococcaceae bacterium]
MVLLLAVTVACAGWPTVRCAAQSTPDDAARATARQLGEQGIEAYRAEDYRAAAEKLDKAYQLFEVPTLGLWSARARERLGHLVEAAERYRDTARASNTIGDSAAQKEAQRTAAQELKALLPRISSLTIQLGEAPPDAVTVTIDGVVVPRAMIGARRPTNPGAHKLEAVLGTEREMLDVLLTEGEHAERAFLFQKLAVTPLPPPSTQPPPSQTARVQPEAGVALEAGPSQLANGEPATKRKAGLPGKPLALGALSVGAAGLLTSAITALLARAQCKDNVCASASALRTHDSLKTASTVTFYLGAAFAVGGVVTWFVVPKVKRPEPNIGLKVGPGGMLLHGMF